MASLAGRASLGGGLPPRCKHARLAHQKLVHQVHNWGPPEPRRAVIGCATQESTTSFEGEDFYSLLGLAPSATSQDIRAAYRQMMRELHPDLVALAGQDVQQEATQLATLLNQIYKTLMDPDARAIYDMLAGFCDADSLNPFLDTSFSRDQVFVDEIGCIGCGKCVRQCPATFEIEASKYGRARVISQTADVPEDIQISIEVCPVSCIYWVSLPQLSLLEAALAVMPRVEVFILQRSGNRAVGNVFEVAYKAFERRKAQASERAQAAAEAAGKSIKVDWSFWTQRDESSGSSNDGGSEDGEQGAGAPQREIAGLAAAAARAVRMWQSQGRSMRIKGALAESSSASLDGAGA